MNFTLNPALKEVDVRNLPELKKLIVNRNPQVTVIHTEGSPKLDLLNAMNDAAITSMPGLKDNPLLAEFYADQIQLKSIDFSHNPRLRKIQNKQFKNIAKYYRIKCLRCKPTRIKTTFYIYNRFRYF